MTKDFFFDGQCLSDFGFIPCSFASSGIEASSLSEITYTEIKAPLSNKSHKVALSYSNNLSKTVQIIKNTCRFNNTYHITNDDISEITKWLCRRNYKWFKWINENDDDEIFYKARINLRKLELLGECVGLELEINTDSPYGYTREFAESFTFDSNTETAAVLNVYSDEEGYIYPDMVITLKESGNLEISNIFENRTTYIGDCKAGEIITITGGDVQQIMTSDETHDLSTSFNYIFPRLCNLYKKSKNEISANLGCDMEMKYRGIRKAGI